MQPTSFIVVLATLAVAAHAAANPEFTPVARAEELQARQLSSIASGITANPGSVLSQASSILASVTGSSSSNTAQTTGTGTDTGASASGTSPAGSGSAASGASGAASSTPASSAITSLQVSAPLVLGAATMVLSTLFGATMVL